jgi:hypothetical protein
LELELELESVLVIMEGGGGLDFARSFRLDLLVDRSLGERPTVDVEMLREEVGKESCLAGAEAGKFDDEDECLVTNC